MSSEEDLIAVLQKVDRLAGEKKFNDAYWVCKEADMGSTGSQSPNAQRIIRRAGFATYMAGNAVSEHAFPLGETCGVAGAFHRDLLRGDPQKSVLRCYPDLTSDMTEWETRALEKMERQRAAHK